MPAGELQLVFLLIRIYNCVQTYAGIVFSGEVPVIKNVHVLGKFYIKVDLLMAGSDALNESILSKINCFKGI